MNYVSQLDAHANWQEAEADAADARAERQAECLAQDWDDCIKERNLDADPGGKWFMDLLEVMNDAACSDEKLNRALMQAIVDSAAQGHAGSIQALALVKDHFIERTMENR
jgi:hypothetical protein